MNSAQQQNSFIRRHLVFGWCCVLGFILLGLMLDNFHAFHVGWYMDTNHQTRRLMSTLAHAHGTLLGGLHIAFAGTLFIVGESSTRHLRLASSSLLSVSLIMPLGFLLAGIFLLEDQPGIAIFLVPVGALLLVVSVTATSFALWRGPRDTPAETKSAKPARRKR